MFEKFKKGEEESGKEVIVKEKIASNEDTELEGKIRRENKEAANNFLTKLKESWENGNLFSDDIGPISHIVNGEKKSHTFTLYRPYLSSVNDLLEAIKDFVQQKQEEFKKVGTDAGERLLEFSENVKKLAEKEGSIDYKSWKKKSED